MALQPDIAAVGYAAGFLDGEGTVNLSKTRDFIRIQVLFTNSYRPTLEWIAERWAAGIYAVPPGRHGHHWGDKQIWMCVLRAGGVRQFLRDAVPYLQQKRDLAINALDAFRAREGGLSLAPYLRRHKELRAAITGIGPVPIEEIEEAVAQMDLSLS